MIKWSAVFFIISIVAAFLGFTGIATGAITIAKALFFIFFILCLVTLAAGKVMLRKNKH